MYLQQTSRNNPYAAFTNYVQTRGLFQGNQPLVPLSSEDMRLSNLIAPALQSQMLHQANLYDGLAAQLLTISLSLNRLTLAANPLVGSGNGFGGTRQGVIAGALPISPSSGSLGSTAAMTLGEVGLNTSSIIAATFAKLNSGSISLNLSNAVAGTSAVISTGSVQLNPSVASSATTATLNGGSISLNTSNATAATAATFTTGSVSLNNTATTPATYATLQTSSVQMIAFTTATLTTGPVAISSGTSATMNNGGGVKLNSTGATDLGSVTIDGVVNTFGSFTGTLTDANNLIVNTINNNGANDVTAAVNKNGQIILTSKTAGSTSTLAITSSTSNANGFKVGTAVGSGNASTDLGSVTVNGVTTNFGLISNAGLTTQSAAQYIVNQINANSSNTVTASVGGNQNNSIVLTSKIAGSAGNFTINAATNESDGLSINNGSNGFVAGTSATGTGASSTDFGSATIAGVKVTFGTLSNSQYNAQSATQFMVNAINSTKGITVTASVAGANSDQILLTSKTVGTAGNFTYTSTNDSNKNLSDDGNNGFGTATYTAGQNATTGQTDFGKVTINGVTTTLGLFNNSGQTAQTATQYLVNQINANSANTVTASVTGANHDQILLTAKTTGSAGDFTLTSSNDSNGVSTDNGINGFATGTYKAGTDYNAGKTDFGSVSINGVTTNFGLFDNNGQTVQTAAQYLVNQLNANSANTVTASVGGANHDQIVLTAKQSGSAGNFTVNAATNNSDGNTGNDGNNGLLAGTSATGKDALLGQTDFGSVTVNGVTTAFGLFNNAGQTVQTATQWLVNKLNANSANTFTAAVGGANNDQIVLTDKTTGSNLTVQSATNDSNNNSADDGKNGFVAGATANGQPGDAGKTDFGSVTINGVVTSFGLFDNNGQTVQSATQYLVNQLNANSSNTVTASVTGSNHDQILLTSKTLGTAGNFSINAATNNSDSYSTNDGNNGFVAGNSAKGTDAFAGTSDFGSVTINGVTTNFGVLSNQGLTAQSAAQYLIGEINGNQANSVVASVGGANHDQIVLTAKQAGSAGTFTINAVNRDSDGIANNAATTGFSSGSTAMGADATGSQSSLPGSSGTPIGTPGQGAVAQGSGGIGTEGHAQAAIAAAQDFAASINQYLKELSAPGTQSSGLSKRYANEMLQALTAPENGLSDLGLSVSDGQVQVDGGQLQAALDRNPDQVYATLSKAQQTLSSTVSTQQLSFEALRQSAVASSQNAEDISKVTVSLFRVDQQTRNLSYLLGSLTQASDGLKSQQVQLDKQHDALSAGPQGSAKKHAFDTRNEPSKQESGSTAAASEANTDKPSSIKSFGLLRSPVADFIGNGNFFTP